MTGESLLFQTLQAAGWLLVILWLLALTARQRRAYLHPELLERIRRALEPELLAVRKVARDLEAEWKEAHGQMRREAGRAASFLNRSRKGKNGRRRREEEEPDDQVDDEDLDQSAGGGITLPPPPGALPQRQLSQEEREAELMRRPTLG